MLANNSTHLGDTLRKQKVNKRLLATWLQLEILNALLCVFHPISSMTGTY